MNDKLIQDIDEYKPANVQAMAKAIYDKQCEYVGADHEKHCVYLLETALQSFEKEIKQARDALKDSVSRDENLIARYIMKLGDEPNSPAQRIQFMGGKWPEHEIAQGGLNEEALARQIADAIKSL